MVATMTEAQSFKSYRNLFVQGLDASVTDAILRSWFTKCGNVRSAKVMMNARTGQSRCIGFVLFETEEEGVRAYAQMSHSVQLTSPGVEGSPKSHLVIEPSDHDGEQAAYETCTVFLRNIPAAVTEEELQRLVARFGEVQKLSLTHIASRKRKSKATLMQPLGDADAEAVAPSSAVAAVPPSVATATPELKMASIDFTTVDSARSCIENLHNTNPFNVSVTLMAKFGDTDKIRDYRKQQRQLRAASNNTPPQRDEPTTQQPSVSKTEDPVAPTKSLLTDLLLSAVQPAAPSSASSSTTTSPPNGTTNQLFFSSTATPSPMLQQPASQSTSSTTPPMPNGMHLVHLPSFSALPQPFVHHQAQQQPQHQVSNPFAQQPLFTFASTAQMSMPSQPPFPTMPQLAPSSFYGAPQYGAMPYHQAPTMYIAVPVGAGGEHAPFMMQTAAGFHPQPTFVVMNPSLPRHAQL